MGSDTLIGRTIGNYVVQVLLGQGGMGEVYRAQHPKIGREVAIKVLPAHLSLQAEFSSRFLSEARAVSKIQHPNVIDVYDFGTLDDGRLYFVMELLRGQELRRIIERRGRMSAEEVLPFLEQICAGLQAAHDQGVVHRDLKPENIFVQSEDPLDLRLLDFGIAKVLEVEEGRSRTVTGAVMGTPLYIAPEQAAGKPSLISPRTDVYSLGVILYRMLTGRFPFDAEITALLLAMHISDPPPPLSEVEPSVPRGVAWVVERCLAKDPESRPASVREVRTAFAEAIKNPNRETLVPGPPDAAGSGAKPLSPLGSVSTLPATPAAVHPGRAVAASELESSATGEPSLGHRTTLSSTVGEVGEILDSSLGRRRSRYVYLSLGVGAVVAVAGALLLLGRSGEGGPETRAASSAAAGPGQPAVVRATPPVAGDAPHDAGPARRDLSAAGEDSGIGRGTAKTTRPAAPRARSSKERGKAITKQKPESQAGGKSEAGKSEGTKIEGGKSEAGKSEIRPQPAPAPKKPARSKIGEGTMEMDD